MPQWFVVALSFCLPGLGHMVSDRVTQGTWWFIALASTYCLPGRLTLLGPAIHVACGVATYLQGPVTTSGNGRPGDEIGVEHRPSTS